MGDNTHNNAGVSASVSGLPGEKGEVHQVPVTEETVGVETLKAALQFNSEIKHLKRLIEERINTKDEENDEELKELNENLEWYQSRLDQCYSHGLDIPPEDLEDLEGLMLLKKDKTGNGENRNITPNVDIYGPESDGKGGRGGGILNLVVCGPGGVGKSAITVMFTSGHFIEEYDPTIEDNFRKQVNVDSEPVVLEILDTAGQEEYKRMREMWMRPAAGFLLVYAIDSNVAFQTIYEWHDQILRVKDLDAFPMVLVGNKSDLPTNERVISTKQGQEMANKWSIPFLETSAKTKYNVDEAFFELVRLVRKSGGGGGGGNLKGSKNKSSVKYGPAGGRLRCTLF